MSELVGFLLIILMTVVTTVATLVLLPFLIPVRVQRTRQVIQAMPGRSFVIGLVNAIFFLLLAVIMLQGGELARLLGGFILLALASLAGIGLAGVVLLLQERIYPEAGKLVSGLQPTLKTAVLLVLAGALPLIGWLVLTPILLMISLGASLMVLVRRGGHRTVPAAEHPDLSESGL